ncbi:MAG: aminotransferase class I/II-fold pyridoxal phosphate-dependent enzyme [Firmicutes bacterium]|nr:aminotransferase class I/II-fold pyridoxal phosphate-dependent enzyme [Alicyclobacillaceae bacterium]MCL6496825.1 aminotransferase class I/II-fold pyridoxal phosphate-dependent enzyme [Bacillota bacterium]
MLVANRFRTMPAYVFAELAEARKQVERQGHRVIDLGASDPDWPPPTVAVDTLMRAAREPESHHYPPYRGWLKLREGIARWYRRRFGVELDPEREVLITHGSKEGLAHLALAVVEPGGLILYPDPGYPTYRMVGPLYGLAAKPLPLDPAVGYLPDFGRVKAGDWERAQLMYLNYPNNPTGAVASLDFWRRAVEWAQRWDVVICSDLAYVDFVWEGEAVSVLQVPEARDLAVESLTFSKSYSMQGWRLGALVGSAEILEAVYKIETQVQSGVFLAVQKAGLAALEAGPNPAALAEYRARRDWVGRQLGEMGWRVAPPQATLYYWLPLPGGWGSEEYAQRLLQVAHVAVTPGTAFGASGHHHLRLSLTRPKNELERAFAQWRSALPELLAP